MARRTVTQRRDSGRARAWALLRSKVLARLAGALLLLAMVAGAWGWWTMRHWTPSRTTFPTQGVEIGAADGDVDWTALKAIGADFAYIDASASAFGHDAQAMKNFDAARAAGMRIGALHRYDPCQPADAQAANFVTQVPRDGHLLPPVVELSALAHDCPEPVSDARVVSELMTFLNQIETHTGKAAILKITPAFEGKYHIARKIDRGIWLTGNRFEPDYAGRPFTLWTANSALANAADDQPLHWVVVQP